MGYKQLGLAAVLTLIAVPSAVAACPPVTPGSMPEAVKANGQRIVCLQNELATAARQRQYDLDFTALERSIQGMQIQRRLDALPAPPVFVPRPVFP